MGEQSSCCGCGARPRKVPAVPSITSVPPSKPAGPDPSWEEAVGRMMLFHKAFIKPLLTHLTNAPSAFLR